MEGHSHRGAVLTGIAGLLVGLLAGLIIGWWVWPVEWTATSLKDLKPEYKDDYIAMVSAAYARDGDLERAVHRLESLQAGNPAQLVVALAERYIAEGRNLDQIQCLAGLAEGLGVRSPQVLAYLATPTPTPTWTFTPTETPIPTATPTWTPLPPTATATPVPPTPPPPAVPYVVQSLRLRPLGQDAQHCASGDHYILATVVDPSGAPLNGVRVREVWTGQVFVTGAQGKGDGRVQFDIYKDGGGQLQIVDEAGNPLSELTRGMASNLPDFDLLYAAGYCNCKPFPDEASCRAAWEQRDFRFFPMSHYVYEVVFQRTY